MQRIAFISSNEYVPWGGSEHCWSAAAEKLAMQGAEVRVGVMHWNPPVRQVEHLRSLGCRIHYRSFPPPLYRRFLCRFLRKDHYERKYMRALASGADLVVISQGGNTDGLRWMGIAQALGSKYALIVQGVQDNRWPDDDIAERLGRGYENACAVYFVSEANLALTRRQLVTPLTKGRVIRNPFNVRYDARPPWPENSEYELLLAFVARVDVGTKRHDLILQVLAHPKWRERRLKLSIVGDGQNEVGMRRLAAELRLTSVRFTGHVTDIESVWASHHALILASMNEGMPLVVVEAMLCGRPAIVTDVGGNRELVRDGVNGFLAKAPTVESIDEAMDRAWENRHRLREMGERAAMDVRQWVSPDPTEDFVRELTALAGAPKSIETAPIGQCQPLPR